MTTRFDLDGGAWLEYLPDWIAAVEADRLLAALRDELAWEQRAIVLFGRRILQPRLIAWSGSLYVHGVPRQPGAAGERISLTFRRLLRAP